MNRRTAGIALALAASAGWLLARLMPPAQEAAAVRRVLFYQSPMHPWVKSATPGECTVCGMPLVPIYEREMSFDHAASDLVMLAPASTRVIGVQTAEVRKRPLVRTLRISGMIGEDESRHGVICAPVEGRLDALAMNHDGQQITRRQPLATVFSRTLLAAAADYKSALAEGGAMLDEAKLKLERSGLVWEQIKAIPDRQPDDKYFGILAPLSGTIVKSYVAEGQYVREGEKLFEIADFTKMWFHFAAAESDLPFIRVGQVVSLRSGSLPGETLQARIAFISPNRDAATAAARVRVVLENPERRIQNNTFAAGTIEIEAPEVLAVARTAVLWPGAAPRVYVEKQTGTYEPRNVRLGRAGDADWEVLAGLSEGERVVTSGGVLIDGQAQLNNPGEPNDP
jgi:Cu(I)/Ag(I) efflux system membrane fusion protein